MVGSLPAKVRRVDFGVAGPRNNRKGLLMQWPGSRVWRYPRTSLRQFSSEPRAGLEVLGSRAAPHVVEEPMRSRPRRSILSRAGGAWFSGTTKPLSIMVRSHGGCRGKGAAQAPLRPRGSALSAGRKRPSPRYSDLYNAGMAVGDHEPNPSVKRPLPSTPPDAWLN